MKTTIEKPLAEHLTIGISDYIAELNVILRVIERCNTEKQLRYHMHENCTDQRHFKYGFGHSHMWVHEKGSKERLLIVEF